MPGLHLTITCATPLTKTRRAETEMHNTISVAREVKLFFSMHTVQPHSKTDRRKRPGRRAILRSGTFTEEMGLESWRERNEPFSHLPVLYLLTERVQ